MSKARVASNTRSASLSRGHPSDTSAPSSANTLASRSTTPATSPSTGTSSPKSVVTATRIPASGRSGPAPARPTGSASSAAKSAAGVGHHTGDRASEPAMTDSARMTSWTERAMAPFWPSQARGSRAGWWGTVPGVARKPTTLVKAAGLRREPPMSEPSASGWMRVARVTAAPPEEPPALREVS